MLPIYTSVSSLFCIRMHGRMVLVSASATQRIVLLRVVAHNNIEFTKFVYFGVRLSMQLVHNKHNEI